MNFEELQAFGQRGRLLVMAACIHGPKAGPPIYANCNRILRQALLWAGLWTEQMEYDERHDIANEVVEDWYRILIAMTHQTPAPLLEGAGNLELPAFPTYTACGLTSKGKEIAEKLFTEFPEYRVESYKP